MPDHSDPLNSMRTELTPAEREIRDFFLAGQKMAEEDAIIRKAIKILKQRSFSDYSDFLRENPGE